MYWSSGVVAGSRVRIVINLRAARRRPGAIIAEGSVTPWIPDQVTLIARHYGLAMDPQHRAPLRRHQSPNSRRQLMALTVTNQDGVQPPNSGFLATRSGPVQVVVCAPDVRRLRSCTGCPVRCCCHVCLSLRATEQRRSNAVLGLPPVRPTLLPLGRLPLRTPLRIATVTDVRILAREV